MDKGENMRQDRTQKRKNKKDKNPRECINTNNNGKEKPLITQMRYT